MASIRSSDPVNRGHPLNRGRLAWWLSVPWLYGGPNWFDLIGQDQGSFVGAAAWRPTSRPGGLGQINFDGSTAGVLVGNVAPINQASSAITVAGWIFPATTVTNSPPIAKKDGSYMLRLASTGKDAQFILFIGGASTTLTTSGNKITVGAWNRVVGTYNGSQLLIYINGISAVSLSYTGSVSVATNPLGLGYGPGKSEYLNGSLDDVSIWNRALSASEVRADFDLSSRGYPPGSGVLNYIDEEFAMLATSAAAASDPSTIWDYDLAGGFQAMGY